jgi:hypothetical protein
MAGNGPTANRRAGVAGLGRYFLGHSVRTGQQDCPPARPGPVCLLMTSNKTRLQQSGTERIDGNARTRWSFLRKEASFLHPHLPRHAAPPAAYDNLSCISLCIASTEWTESKEHRRSEYPASKHPQAVDGKWMAKPMVALPSLYEMTIKSLPGDRQSGDLVPVCPMPDAAPHFMSVRIPLLVLVRSML